MEVPSSVYLNDTQLRNVWSVVTVTGESIWFDNGMYVGSATCAFLSVCIVATTND